MGFVALGMGFVEKNWTGNWDLGKIWAGKWDLDPPRAPPSGPSTNRRARAICVQTPKIRKQTECSARK